MENKTNDIYKVVFERIKPLETHPESYMYVISAQTMRDVIKIILNGKPKTEKSKNETFKYKGRLNKLW